jgi:CRISPR/Cas system-associated endonuclease Cas3-HD
MSLIITALLFFNDLFIIACVHTMGSHMKKKDRLNLRISEKRMNKFRLYAVRKEKTMTQLIEDWIDRLPSLDIDNQSDTQ